MRELASLGLAQAGRELKKTSLSGKQLSMEGKEKIQI